MTTPSRRLVTSDTRIGGYVVLALIAWVIFRLAFRLYGADKWQTVYIPECNCQIDVPLYWANNSNNAKRSADDVVSWYTSSTDKVKIFFQPEPITSIAGLESWMDEYLIKQDAHYIYDLGEQIIGKGNILARYTTYQLAYDHRIYYFFSNDGYYAIDFYSRDFSKNEEMFTHILASFEILE